MVHVNYHPDKFARMQSIWARYVENDMHALDKYPVGGAGLREGRSEGGGCWMDVCAALHLLDVWRPNPSLLS